MSLAEGDQAKGYASGHDKNRQLFLDDIEAGRRPRSVGEILLGPRSKVVL
jgi:hypothetical protein